MWRLLVAAVLLVLVQAPAAHAADAGPWALFDGSPAIADPDANESINVELGTRFSVAAPASGAYWLTKVRYWRAPNRAINTTASTSMTRAAARSRAARSTSPTGPRAARSTSRSPSRCG